MPRLSAEPIELNELERTELEKLLKRPRTPQQVALRAKIVLRADKYQTTATLASSSENGTGRIDRTSRFKQLRYLT